MKILFALLSILIIYPIILVLPVGIKAKPKLFLSVIALFISLLGILTENILPLSQTFLIIVALAGLSTILISKRLPETKESTLNHPEDIIIQKGMIIEEDIKMEQEVKWFSEKSDNKMVDRPLEEVAAAIMEIEPPIAEDKVLIDEPILNVEFEDISTIYEELNANLYVSASVENEEELDELDFLREFEQLDEFNHLEGKEDLEVTKGDIDVLKDLNKETPLKSSLYLSEIERLLEEGEEENPILEDKPQSPSIKKIKLEKLY